MANVDYSPASTPADQRYSIQATRAGGSVLHAAAREGRSEVLLFLLSKFSEQDSARKAEQQAAAMQ